MDERTLERLKWRSRRGLLELDLVFERFWAGAGAWGGVRSDHRRSAEPLVTPKSMNRKASYAATSWRNSSFLPPNVLS